MVDIFDEVSEDLRADKARALFFRYGWLLLTACALSLVAVGGWQYEQTRADAENQRVAGLFSNATTLASTAVGDRARQQALAAFANVVAQDHKGYTPLALMNEASLEYDSGNRVAALASWDQVANDTAAPTLMRDLASLLWAQHQLDQADPGVLTARLQPLLVSSNPWHGLASEEMALLQLRQGQTAQARARLQALEADTTATQAARERAAALLASLAA